MKKGVPPQSESEEGRSKLWAHHSQGMCHRHGEGGETECSLGWGLRKTLHSDLGQCRPVWWELPEEALSH